MSDDRPAKTGRSIVIILAVSGVLGIAFFLYLSRSMKPPEPIKLTDAGQAPRNAGFVHPPDPLRDVSMIATAFVEPLAARQFAAAYATMASSYQEAIPLPRFEKAITGSKFLSGALKIRFSKLIETAIPVDGGLLHAVTRRAVGNLVTSAGVVATEVVFLREEGGEKILSVSIEGVPVIQGMTAEPR